MLHKVLFCLLNRKIARDLISGNAHLASSLFDDLKARGAQIYSLPVASGAELKIHQAPCVGAQQFCLCLELRLKVDAAGNARQQKPYSENRLIFLLRQTVSKDSAFLVCNKRAISQL